MYTPPRSFSDRNAIIASSGENAGSLSSAGSCVMRRGSRPPTCCTQISRLSPFARSEANASSFPSREMAGEAVSPPSAVTMNSSWASIARVGAVVGANRRPTNTRTAVAAHAAASVGHPNPASAAAGRGLGIGRSASRRLVVFRQVLQQLLHVRHVLPAIVRLLAQALRDQAPQRARRDVRIDRRGLVVKDRRQRGDGILLVERLPPGQHLVQHAAEGEDVRS